MIKIQEPSRPWETFHMDWVTGLPPAGDKSYNSFLVIVDRFSKTPIVFLPCHKNDTAMDTALLICNIVVSWTEIFPNIMSDRDPKFTSALWKNFQNFFGTKSFFYKAYHPHTDGLTERIIQTLEDINRIFHKEWNTRLPQDSLRKEFVGIHATASSFKGILDRARKHLVRFMEDPFAYAKEKWGKFHATQDFNVGDLVLVSTPSFNNIKGCKKLKESFAGPFVVKALHGINAVKVKLSEELSNKHPKFPVSLIKPYKSSDAGNFPL
ncbi:hypothetical protein O181_054613 [Austropuccinia psidii MF-1]|uniref:Integrase catalytic domain-containing protein n=1 Tax=Austropuccinia psidii MF-1 TaxID=1389203 RepID=A0A9Q3HRL2_9BASI|nr:hypothetical protein [Austropuccinia psidii MF-1]